jgi:hypothetical protein
MTKLIYSNYLVNENFNFKEEYFSDLTLITKFTKPNEDINKRFNRYKVNDNSFKKVFRNYALRDILFASNEELPIIISIFEKRISSLTQINKKGLLVKIKDLFKYEKKYQRSVLTPFFTKNFNFKTCFYCNKDYISNFEKKENSKEFTSTFQLDHFYDKGTYPYLALSFYNLIPSCYVCNAKVKGSKNTFTRDSKVDIFENETCLSPNNKDFNFENKVKFKLFLDKDCKNLHIKDKEDIDIPLKEQFSNEYDKYIEVFKLNERYKAHKDIVYEMMINAQRYPESRLKELQNLTGIPFQQIRKDIFNLIDQNKDLSKKPFSKLIKDISEELKL